MKETMKLKSRYLFKIVFLLVTVLSVVSSQDDSVLKADPSNAVKEGTTVTISCDLPQGQGNVGVTWTQKRKSHVRDIYRNGDVEVDIENTGRYLFSNRGNSDGGNTYLLTIKDIQYEDTASIGCEAANSGQIHYITMAVCTDPESAGCQCIVEKGWRDPACYEEPPAVAQLQSSYKKTVGGLVACLVIAIIYAVIVTVLFTRDFMQKSYQKSKKSMERVATAARANNAGFRGGEPLRDDATDSQTTERPDYEATRDYGFEEQNSYAKLQQPSNDRTDTRNHVYDDPRDNGYVARNGDVPRSPRSPYGAQGIQADVHAPHRDYDQPQNYNSREPELSQNSSYQHSPRATNPYPAQLSVSYEQQQYNAAPPNESMAPPKYNNIGDTSPSARSTPGGGYGQPDNQAYYPRQQPYSDMPRDKYMQQQQAYPRNGYSDPKKLDFTGQQRDRVPQGAYMDPSDRVPQGAYVDQSDTVV